MTLFWQLYNFILVSLQLSPIITMFILVSLRLYSGIITTSLSYYYDYYYYYMKSILNLKPSKNRQLCLKVIAVYKHVNMILYLLEKVGESSGSEWCRKTPSSSGLPGSLCRELRDSVTSLSQLSFGGVHGSGFDQQGRNGKRTEERSLQPKHTTNCRENNPTLKTFALIKCIYDGGCRLEPVLGRGRPVSAWSPTPSGKSAFSICVSWRTAEREAERRLVFH